MDYQMTEMKKLSLILMLACFGLTGCVRNYTITLSNGTQLGAQGKPVFKNGAYYFKDAAGKETSVAAGRVSQIEPAVMASKSNKPGFISGSK